MAWTAPERARRIPAPAGIFSASRPPPFVLFDEDSHEVAPGGSGDGPKAMIYVSTSDEGALRGYLLRHLHTIVTAQSIDPADRAWALHRALLLEMSEAFRDPVARVPAANLRRIAREAAAFLAEHRGGVAFLDAATETHYTLESHAVETALFATALAAADGSCDASTLAAITIGGLFADSGKLELPAEMLRRDGPLSAAEWERMHVHPRHSVEAMRRAGVAPAAAVRGVLSHHERGDGSGYPAHLLRADIPFEAQCIGIADAFSAMTVERPFRSGRDAYSALTEMASAGHQFDPGLLRHFVLLLRSDAAADGGAERKAAPADGPERAEPAASIVRFPAAATAAISGDARDQASAGAGS